MDDELALLPFSLQVDSLIYEIAASQLAEINFQSLNIVAKKLSVTVYNESDQFPTDIMLSFWRRVADLGHFVELKVKIRLDEGLTDVQEAPHGVMQESFRAVLANPHLTVLDLCDKGGSVDWDENACHIFKSLKAHKGLKTLKINVFGEEDDSELVFAISETFYRITGTLQ